MSSIIDALKKAQQEEKDKQEKKADRVVWLVPDQKKYFFLSPSWIQWIGLFFVLGVLTLCVGWGIHSLRKDQRQDSVVSKEKAPAKTKNSTPLPSSLPPEEDLKLSGILWDPTEPIALINSEMVKKGDQIEGGVVVRISREQVELSFDGTPKILSLERE